MHDDPKNQDTFNKGEPVPAPGKYVCVPCGFTKEYQAGEAFGECTSCMAGTGQGQEEFVDGMEMWEKL
ncbi:hypothetical protein HY224_03075 [Candidatus Uhrbacteria bacterium]|nr:hypothetical protein [Candidatus Uhrbacteria bacterium]